MRHWLSYWRARYASGVRVFDQRIGSLLELLRERGLLDRCIVVVTSDHGEELFEHGDWGHGRNLYDHQLHVPLLVRYPGGSGRGTRVRDMVELIDLMPTLLARVGVQPPPGLQGRDLAATRLQPSGGASFATATQQSPGLHSMRTLEHKLVLDVPSGRSWLYAVAADPGEHQDQTAREPELSAELRYRLGLHLSATVAGGTLEPEPGQIPREALERLRALGYVH